MEFPQVVNVMTGVLGWDMISAATMIATATIRATIMRVVFLSIFSLLFSDRLNKKREAD